MIDFKEEISKYKPVRTVDEVESALNDEVLDIMDLLQYISGRTSGDGGSENSMPQLSPQSSTQSTT